MISFKTLASIGLVWLLLAILGAIFDGGMQAMRAGTIEGQIANQGTALNTLLTQAAFNWHDVPFTNLQLPWPNVGYFTAIGSLMLFNYSFFTGYYNYIRAVFCIVLAMPFAYDLLKFTIPQIAYLIGSVRSRVPFIN